MQVLKQRLSRLITDDGASRAFSFKPCPDNMFFVTPPMCGTTWMQHILHQLPSGGAKWKMGLKVDRGRLYKNQVKVNFS